MKNQKFLLLVTCYMLLVASFDSFRFAQKWMPFDPKDLVYPELPVISAIKENIGDGRIFGNIGTEVNSYYGIPSIEGYDPLYISRYGEFIRSANSGDFLEAERSVAKLNRNAKYADRVLDILGVSLIFHPKADTNQGWAYPVWNNRTRNEVIYEDDKFQLFRNTMAMPRAMLFYDYEVIQDGKQIVRRFYSEDFDFRTKVILEEEPRIERLQEGSGSARIISYKPNSITIKVETKASGILFLSDNYYPGWRVTVNPSAGSGQVETKIYRANYTFRAVPVPAGESMVEFTYTF